jgi:hypothetical protein
MLWAEITNSKQRFGPKLMNLAEQFASTFRRSASRDTLPQFAVRPSRSKLVHFEKAIYSFRSLAAFCKNFAGTG